MTFMDCRAQVEHLFTHFCLWKVVHDIWIETGTDTGMFHYYVIFINGI